MTALSDDDNFNSGDTMSPSERGAAAVLNFVTGFDNCSAEVGEETIRIAFY